MTIRVIIDDTSGGTGGTTGGGSSSTTTTVWFTCQFTRTAGTPSTLILDSELVLHVGSTPGDPTTWIGGKSFRIGTSEVKTVIQQNLASGVSPSAVKFSVRDIFPWGPGPWTTYSTTVTAAPVYLQTIAVDNLIPNPTSELGDVAAGQLGFAAALVVNDATNSYAGSWCRKLDASATNQTAVSALIPCVYGDQFTFDAYIKGSSGTPGAKLRLVFTDASGTTTGTADSAEVKSSTYTTIRVQGQVPATTVAVQAFVLASTTAASSFLYFDQLSLRRSVKPGHMDADSGFRVLNALKNSGTTTSDRTYYVGNNDLAVRGGAPNINCLTITPQVWDTTLHFLSADFKLQPTAANDNLDGMRYAKVQLYKQSAAGTTATLTAVGSPFFVPLTDRLFANSSDSNSANASLSTGTYVNSGIAGGTFPAMLVTIYSANGPSDTNCFYSPGGWTAGTALTNNGTSWPAGITGGSGGTFGGGSGGGGGCPAPWVMIDLPGGLQKSAGEIQVGDLVWTQDPSTGTIGQWPVLAAVPEENDRYDVTFEDGLSLTFSKNHRFRTPDGWVEIQDLQPGTVVVGDRPQKVAVATFRDHGEVIRLTVDKAHSYMTSGLLSSNVKNP